MPRSLLSVVVAGAFVGVIASTTKFVCAAEPSIMDCLAASENSLKFSQEHKLRAERAQLLICAAETCPSDIRKECLSRFEQVNAAIPAIVFEAKDARGSDLSAVRVTMDGEVLAERLNGTSVAVDPGEHSFLLESPGARTVEKRLLIRESQKDRREVIVFEVQAPPSEKVGVQPVQPERERAATAKRSGIGTQRVLALVSGGIGVVGIGLGSYFGIQAMSKKESAQDACPERCRNQQDSELWGKAQTAGNLSTTAFIVGGTGLAGAAMLWFTNEKTPTASARVRVGFGRVALEGSW